MLCVDCAPFSDQYLIPEKSGLKLVGLALSSTHSEYFHTLYNAEKRDELEKYPKPNI